MSVARALQPQPRAAIYVRVSTAPQARSKDDRPEWDNGHRQETSLETQEAACRAYAAERGYVVEDRHVYREVYTGAALHDRAVLTALREAGRRREFAAAICYALDRLSRKQTHVAIVADDFEQAEVRLLFMTEDFEDGPVGTFIRSAKAFAAELEREKIRERTMRGKRARVASGKILAAPRPVYGYAFAAGRGASEVARGTTVRALAPALSREGIPSPSGRAEWATSSLLWMLRNDNYIGRAVAWRRGGDDTRVELPAGTVPPIVDEALFEAANARLRLNQLQAPRNNRAPLAALLRGGLARCGHCGSTMTVWRRSHERRAPYYHCNKRARAPGSCTHHAIRIELLDDAAWGRVEALLTRPEIVEAELKRLLADDTVAADLAALERAIAGVARQQRNLVEQLANVTGAVAELVTEKLSGLEKHRKALSREREAVLDRDKSRRCAREGLAELAHWHGRVSANLGTLSYEQKRMALLALGVQVTVWRPGHTPRYQIEASIPIDAAIVDNTPRCAGRWRGRCPAGRPAPPRSRC